MSGAEAAIPKAARRAPALARFLDEILLYSGQYALFYVLMNLADQKAGFFSDVGHTTLLLSLILQTIVLVALGHIPLVRFFGSLITPAIYAAFEISSLSGFFLDIAHFNFWLFSILVGGLQALALMARQGRVRFALKFFSTFISVMIFLFVYFYFDVRVTHEEMIAAGTLTQAQLPEHMRISAYGPNLAQFLSDATHIYVILGGVLLAFALALGRVKILRLTERISALFGTYVDGRVRDRIIHADGRLGETAEVAILFADIRNFTSITERSDASAVVGMLNTYFSEWDRVSLSHGGIIDKFIGDAVMIIFEPRAGSDPSHDAVLCAFEMLGRLDALRARMREGSLAELPDIGVGIDYGGVILGNIGSARRRNYTAIGDVVNTASRLESACKEFRRHLIVSETVYRRLDDAQRARLTALGQIPLKGKAATLHVYGT